MMQGITLEAVFKFTITQTSENEQERERERVREGNIERCDQ